MNANYGLMIELNKDFQKELFTKLLKKYNSKELSKIVGRTSASMYLYKNNRIRGLSIDVLNRAIKLTNISKKELKFNTIRIYDAKKERRKILDKGVEIRQNQLKSWKRDIPKINEIITEKYVLLENWFNKYIKLINFGTRNFIKIKKLGNKIKIVYTNYSKSKKKLFINYLPAKIEIDEDFQYFFGLWCGDRLGSGRFGVANKNKEINFYTKYYLNRLYQKSEFVLVYNNGIKKPKIKYKVDKTILIKTKNKIKGYCINVGIKNRIMFSFFDYLYKNLDEVLDLIPNKNIFFAGLFDAEGNVFLEGNCLRWSCMNELNLKIFKKHLSLLGLFHRYDGCNLVTYNKEYFAKNLLSYLKHPQKINNLNLLINKEGFLEERFKNILNEINNYDGITNRCLAKVLKRVRVYNQTRFLERNGYIKSNYYPKKMYITQKGLEQLQGARTL